MERILDPVPDEWRAACSVFLDAIPEDYERVSCHEDRQVINRDPRTGRFIRPLIDAVPVFQFERGGKGVAVAIPTQHLGDVKLREGLLRQVSAAFRWAT